VIGLILTGNIIGSTVAGLIDIAHTIIKSTCQVLRKNNRTFDIGTEQHTILSTSDIGKLIIEQLEKNLSESSFRTTATG